MEQKLQKSGLAITSLVLGLISFIPLLGIFLGALAIILGIVSLMQIKKMGLGGKKMAIAGIILGVLGIIFTFAFYGSLFYFGFVSDKGPWVKLRPQINQQMLTQNVGALEIYKKQNGQYPDSLEGLIKLGFTIFPMDYHLNPFFYEVSQDGQSYDLRSLGADGKYGTSDDEIPTGQIMIPINQTNYSTSLE